MDLYAYALSRDELVERYVEKHYGEVPRMRGVRLMRFMEPGNLGCGGLEDEMYERRGVKKRESKGGRRTGEVLTEWVGLECYPRTVDSACVWILENGNGYTRDESLTLEEAIAEYREIADALTRNVKRYAKAVNE